jgi:hypothetical protein
MYSTGAVLVAALVLAPAANPRRNSARTLDNLMFFTSKAN